MTQKDEIYRLACPDPLAMRHMETPSKGGPSQAWGLIQGWPIGYNTRLELSSAVSFYNVFPIKRRNESNKNILTCS